MEQMEQKNQINSVAKALSVLEIVGISEKELTLTEIAKNLDMHKSTAFRLLSTLESRGFISKETSTGKYTLGLKILRLAGELLDNIDIRKIARPILEKLVEDCNETVHLVVMESNNIIYIDKVEGCNTIRLYSRIGMHGFAHSTSAGKVLLAFLPERKIKNLILETELPKKTPKTIVDYETLMEHLEVVRKQGYAIDDIENEDGVRCVAAPVRNHLGQVVAAVSIAGPCDRISIERIENSLANKAIVSAETISRLLGYRSSY
ncbi:MAG: hypothetical protein APF76_08945 [Desulfitibacter sp. BRH_c19]|nr:MAG: hypothetical protein APF76_08945 [Desulfitibacter sp. BRH_c19]